MIDWLRIAKSAYFYRRRKRLPKTAISELFRTLRLEADAPSNNLFHHIRENFDGASWSAICFFYNQEPAFLQLPARQTRERICGFILFVEYRDFAVLFKSGLDLTSDFKSEYLERVGNERVEGSIAQVDATFEQIRLRNMAVSKYALRSKTLEANDLQSVVGPSGVSRYVPQGYRVRRGSKHYSATPSTGRISLRSDRSDHHELIRWCIAEIDELITHHPATSSFIRTFARPIDLVAIPHDTKVTALAIDVAYLTEQLYEVPEPLRLVRDHDGEMEVLTKPSVDVVFAALDQTFPVRDQRSGLKVIDQRSGKRVGELLIGKTRISLRAFALAETEDVFVEVANPAANAERIALKRYIDRNDLFTVLFSDFDLAYIDGSLYRDELLTDGGGNLLKHIRANPGLNNAQSEKGTFSPQQTTFDVASVFGAVTGGVAAGDNVLICDDLGDEWADFIGINSNTQPKTISFYHAKHAGAGLGAGPFHVAVSQAIKNLGRMTLASDAVATKLPRWSEHYLQTQIPRLVRGDAAALEQTIADARTAPDTIRRVFIVTSSLSRQQLEKVLADIKAGAPPTPHFVQLYWLLLSYLSACAEVGAYGYVVCRD